jgi:hypothetical protein
MASCAGLWVAVRVKNQPYSWTKPSAEQPTTIEAAMERQSSRLRLLVEDNMGGKVSLAAQRQS